MLTIDYRSAVKFFILEGLNATEISKELDECQQKQCSVGKCLAQFKHPQRAFKDSPRTGVVHSPSPLIKTFKPYNVSESVIGKSVRRLAYELTIPTTITITVYQIISNHLGMQKVSTGWVPNTYSTFSGCCQEFLQEREVNPDNYFHRIVTGGKTCLYDDDPFSEDEVKVWKKAGEETTT